MTINLQDVKGGFNTTTINSNFQEIERQFKDNVLSTDQGNNQMEQELDMNSNHILNLPAPRTSGEPLRLEDLRRFEGKDVSGVVPEVTRTVGDAVRTRFPTGLDYVADSKTVMVYINGERQFPDVDYETVDLDIQFISKVPDTNEWVEVYSYSPQTVQGPLGPRGPRGLDGPEGPQGPQGQEGPQGIQGIEGPQGVVGPTPIHEFGDGITEPTTSIRFALKFNPDTGKVLEWGNWSNIVGPQGPLGPQGPVGPTPTHQFGDGVIVPDTSVRFATKVDVDTGAVLEWGNWSDLKGEVGPVGPQGPQGNVGPSPAYEWSGTRIRFLQSDGTYGQWTDLVGPHGPLGPVGPRGIKGDRGPQGIEGPKGDRGDIGPQGPKGDKGDTGVTGATGSQGPQGPKGDIGASPKHEWQGSTLRFQNPDATWGAYTDLIGPQGVTGPIGPKGEKGEKGDSLTVSEVGTYSERSRYDNEDTGFVFFAKDYAFNAVDAEDVFTGNGTQTNFVLSFTTGSDSNLFVWVGNSYQTIKNYSLVNQLTLSFDTPPYDGARIIVRKKSPYVSVGALFVKLSNNTGDWSEPYPFGAGPQGAQGPIGPAGIQGPQGRRGPQGPEGVRGPQGLPGIQGPQGDRGPTGLTGAIGPRGPQGDKGETGNRGPIGLQGPEGAKGEKGDTGAIGPVGPQGPRGPEGEKGAQGDTGLRGPQGPIGPQGPRGLEGPKGVQGDRGIPGPQGQQGIRGPEGPKGVQGDRGIVGQQGPQGERGPQGVEGPLGPRGAQGPAGPKGPTGDRGPTGPTGHTGPKGPRGDQGQRGSREWFIATTATSWSNSLRDAVNPHPIVYDIVVQYNSAGGYSESRVYRGSGRWDLVELVHNNVVEYLNGVQADRLKIGSASKVGSQEWSDKSARGSRLHNISIATFYIDPGANLMLNIAGTSARGTVALNRNFGHRVIIKVNGSVKYQTGQTIQNSGRTFNIPGISWVIPISASQQNKVEIIHEFESSGNYSFSEAVVSKGSFSWMELLA